MGISAVSVVSVVSVDAVVSVAAGVAVVELAQAAMLSSIRAARTRARILLIVFIHLSFFIFPDRLHKSNKKVGRFCKEIHGMNRKRNSPPLPLPSIALHKVFLCDSPADVLCRPSAEKPAVFQRFGGSPFRAPAAGWPCRRVLMNTAPLSKRFNFECILPSGPRLVNAILTNSGIFVKSTEFLPNGGSFYRQFAAV